MCTSSTSRCTKREKTGLRSRRAIPGRSGSCGSGCGTTGLNPGSVKGVVVDSNIFKRGSTWELRATPADGGGSRVEVIAVRHLKGVRGKALAPVFPLGLARRAVADHLRHFLSKVDEAAPEPG